MPNLLGQDLARATPHPPTSSLHDVLSLLNLSWRWSSRHRRSSSLSFVTVRGLGERESEKETTCLHFSICGHPRLEAYACQSMALPTVSGKQPSNNIPPLP